jgi:hypothetical protein
VLSTGCHQPSGFSCGLPLDSLLCPRMALPCCPPECQHEQDAISTYVCLCLCACLHWHCPRVLDKCVFWTNAKHPKHQYRRHHKHTHLLRLIVWQIFLLLLAFRTETRSEFTIKSQAVIARVRRNRVRVRHSRGITAASLVL